MSIRALSRFLAAGMCPHFPLCVLFVFLTLAAQYESWSLPFAIVLIVPMCIFSALAGVLIRNFTGRAGRQGPVTNS